METAICSVLMIGLIGTFLLCATTPVVVGAPQVQSPAEIVYEYVKEHANETFRQPKGILKFPYLVPSGPYNQLWDWDSMFTGVALFEFGSAPYLSGSMENFLYHTNVQSGEVQGCLLPSGATGTIFHAKPVIIQGAWLAAQEVDRQSKSRQKVLYFKRYAKQMAALLRYWTSTVRTDDKTQLPKWYNQLESGQDNLPLSTCASSRSPCWNPAFHELRLVSADLATFLYREFVAYGLFNKRWAKEMGDERGVYQKEYVRANEMAEKIKMAVNRWLFDDSLGYYIALNRTERVTNRVDVMGFPMWANISSRVQAHKLRVELLKADMLSPFGIRSTSALDPSYNNINEIKPYSNWQGPVWVNANAVLTYGLSKYGYRTDAINIAKRVVQTLANDAKIEGTWHEGYNSENGKGLAANGFLSWNTLAATLEENLMKGHDPFELQDHSNPERIDHAI